MASPSLQRPALSRRIGLPRHSVSDLLGTLESRGFVHVAGTHDGLPGRSQLSYALRANAALAMGFDVGGTKISGAVCDMRGTLLAEHTEPSTRRGADALVTQIASIADRLCSHAGLPRYHVRNTTIGVPAAVDPRTGRLSLAGNMPGIEGAALLEPLTSALGGHVHLDNDVNLALVAEVRSQPDASANMAFIALGTGIGSALMVNGHLLRGAHGGAGEIGYLPLWQLDFSGTPALENQVGEAGIRRLYVAAGGATEHSVEQIFGAAANGDHAAHQALDQAAQFVARGVVSILALVDAETVVFGGSVGAREEFIDRVRPLVSAAWPRPIVIRRSQTGSRAGLLGSVEMARQQLLADLFGPA